LWLTLQALPLAAEEGLGPILAAGVRAARALADRLDADPGWTLHVRPQLDIVTYAPPGWSKRLRDEPGVRLHAPGGQDLIRRLYSQTDVLLFPSHMDTYGVVVGEAMAHGLPVLAPRHLALTETVEDEVSGLLFPPENMLWREDTRCRFKHTIPVPASYLESLRHPSEGYVAGIAAALARLAEEAALYDRLATGCFETVSSGRLSMERRRALLSEIYDAAAA
jgi:glycosyltransferase involved in cell wall biosynthesis